jgi:hypothetical protein
MVRTSCIVPSVLGTKPAHSDPESHRSAHPRITRCRERLSIGYRRGPRRNPSSCIVSPRRRGLSALPNPSLQRTRLRSPLNSISLDPAFERRLMRRACGVHLRGVVAPGHRKRVNEAVARSFVSALVVITRGSVPTSFGRLPSESFGVQRASLIVRAASLRRKGHLNPCLIVRFVQRRAPRRRRRHIG